MSDALFSALSQVPPNEAAAFHAMRTGAHLSPAQLEQLRGVAIALYAKLLGLVELRNAAAYWVQEAERSTELRERAQAAAKRIFEGAAMAYGTWALSVIANRSEPIIEPDEEQDRDHGLSR